MFKVLLVTNAGKEYATSADETTVDQVIERFADLDAVCICHETGYDGIVPHRNIDSYRIMKA